MIFSGHLGAVTLFLVINGVSYLLSFLVLFGSPPMPDGSICLLAAQCCIILISSSLTVCLLFPAGQLALTVFKAFISSCSCAARKDKRVFIPNSSCMAVWSYWSHQSFWPTTILHLIYLGYILHRIISYRIFISCFRSFELIYFLALEPTDFVIFCNDMAPLWQSVKKKIKKNRGGGWGRVMGQKWDFQPGDQDSSPSENQKQLSFP